MLIDPIRLFQRTNGRCSEIRIDIGALDNLQRHRIAYAGVNDTPALDFAGTNRVPHARADGCFSNGYLGHLVARKMDLS